jgi:hypothetical protein
LGVDVVLAIVLTVVVGVAPYLPARRVTRVDLWARFGTSREVRRRGRTGGFYDMY